MRETILDAGSNSCNPDGADQGEEGRGGNEGRKGTRMIDENKDQEREVTGVRRKYNTGR